MKDKIKEILGELGKMPIMHGDYQLDLLLAQDLMNLLRKLQTLSPKAGEDGLLSPDDIYRIYDEVRTNEWEGGNKLPFDKKLMYKPLLKAQKALTTKLIIEEIDEFMKWCEEQSWDTTRSAYLIPKILMRKRINILKSKIIGAI